MSSLSQNPHGRENGEIRIDICVCTYRRPELELTLRSLGALEPPPDAILRIIVADNDTQPSARILVEALRSELPFELLYVHCPASNISIARNACLDTATGEYLAFIDDDETASAGWLVELTEVARATGADAVLGPVSAVYSDAAPGWMRRGDFHSTLPVFVGAQIRTGYSCNVLLRRASPHIAGRRFSLAAGQTGGEDTEYFTQMVEAGGRMAYAPRALVIEPVPQARARFSWLAKRRFRSGQTHGRLLGRERAAAGLFRPMALAGAKAVYCFGAAAALAVVAQHRNRYALRGVLHTGVVVGLLGIREIRLYGDGRPLGRHSNAA
jgi:succinoglycan biosynthesis protein ExoM